METVNSEIPHITYLFPVVNFSQTMKFQTTLMRPVVRFALAVIGGIALFESVLADNPPPCQPCKMEELPTGNVTDITETTTGPVREGIEAFVVYVTFKANGNPQGSYLQRCWNNMSEDDARKAYDCNYDPPTQERKRFTLGVGGRKSVMSDNFDLKFTDPCTGEKRTAAQISKVIWIDAGTGGTAGGGSATGEGTPEDPYVLPPPVDPYTGPGDTGGGPGGPGGPGEPGGNDDCYKPFVPGHCSPFNNPDTRTATTLPPPTQVEIVAENINFTHLKNGFRQYDYDIAHPAIPKYFLQEDAHTEFSGDNAESPIGGSITRRICPMTGELIQVAKKGNPSFHGVRAGEGVVLTETTASGSISVGAYDDCPNRVMDQPATMTFGSTLSDEYTTEQMRDDAFEHSWDFRGDGYYLQQNASAALWIGASGSTTEEQVTYWKTKYKIRVPSNLPRPYKALWVEEFTPEDPNPNDDQVPETQYNLKKEDIWNAESLIHFIDPQSDPEKEGTWTVHLLSPIEIEVKRGGIGDADGKAPTNTPSWRSQEGLIRDVISLWDTDDYALRTGNEKSDWLQVRVKLPPGFPPILPPNTIKWDIPDYSTPADNTIETPQLGWPGKAGDNYQVRVTVAGSVFAVNVDLPDVGTLNHAGWVLLMEATSGVGEIGILHCLAAKSLAEEWSNSYNDKPSVKNALRHSCWISYCASDSFCGPDLALLLGMAHEYNNKVSGTWPYESTMDLHNNAIGSNIIHPIIYFDYLIIREDIKNDLLANLENGSLWIWDSDGEEHTGFKATMKSNDDAIYPSP